MRPLLTLLAALLLLASGGALAQPRQTTLMGVVADQSSAIMAGVPVLAIGVGRRFGDTTEFDGRFAMSLVPGTYQVIASRPGYLAKPQTVTLAAGRRTFVRLKLSREVVPPVLLRR